MSAPRRRKRRKHGLSRRGFLKSAGLASALPLLASCSRSVPGADTGSTPGTPAPPSAPSATFAHGVASGDPLGDRVMLWTRISGASAGETVSYVVASDPELKNVVTTASTTADAARDFTVKVDAGGLSPAMTYYYQFSARGEKSPVGRTRTLPVGGVERLRFAVVSCSSLAHGLFNAYRRVAERSDLDCVIHLGDYIYEYSSGGDDKEIYGEFRSYDPPTEIVTLSDYRRRYAQYHTDADLQELHRQHPMINVWDDHETADNSWQGGAFNHNEQGDEGDWDLRVSQALQAFYEWLPVRPVSSDPRQNHRTFKFGDLVDLVMLESRLIARNEPLAGVIQAPPPLPSALQVFADTGAFAEESRTLLGAEQENWLAGQLRSSTAKWKLLGQQVMLGQLKVVGTPNLLGASLYLNPDQWDGYPRARDRLHSVLAEGINNVVVLTGDIHTAWAMDITPDPNNPIAYNPLTGSGSLAVEFVATSITSPGLPELEQVQDAIRLNNPHIKFVDLASKGYLLLDITAERCQAEFWTVDTIEAPSSNESLAASFSVADGANTLGAGLPGLPGLPVP